MSFLQPLSLTDESVHFNLMGNILVQLNQRVRVDEKGGNTIREASAAWHPALLTAKGS